MNNSWIQRVRLHFRNIAFDNVMMVCDAYELVHAVEKQIQAEANLPVLIPDGC